MRKLSLGLVASGVLLTRVGLRDDEPSRSWNSWHPSRGCSDDALRSTGGAGFIYCFAAN